MSKQNKKITMQDVAKHAGVSYQTVSRVLNNSCNVSEGTKAKIQKAIEELKYSSNLIELKMQDPKRKVIGLISEASNLQAPSDITSHAREYALAADYSIQIELISTNDLSELSNAVKNLKNQNIVKILISAPVNTLDAIELSNQYPDCRLLFADVDPYSPVFNVTFNPADGTLFSVNLLQKQGHKKIALIKGPEGNISSDLRLKCWREALRINNLEEVCVEEGDWTAQSGYYATLKMLRDKKDFTAILIANDQMAMGAISALTQNHISVPEDVSVIGYDDYSDSAFYQPPLTSIHLDRDLQCKIAIGKLVDDNDDKVSSILPTTLVQRNSTSTIGKKREDVKQIAEVLRVAASIIEKQKEI